MDVSDELIQEAFALSEARGAALLSALGNYNVWHGDLAEMRDDSPRVRRTEQIAATSARFADVVLLSRTLGLLDPDCKAALSANGRGMNRERAIGCKRRLIELYSELQRREGAAILTHGSPE